MTEYIPEWRRAPCQRCGVVHPRHCDLCAGSPACQDHECSWPEDGETDAR